MTSISKAYDALIAQIEITLPSHIELINPYRPELNDFLTYDAAWGLGFLDGQNSNREIGCNYTIRRNFSLILTRKIFKGDLSRSVNSVTERRNSEKQLFEDLHLIVKDIENSATLNQGADSEIAWCRFISDSGLEFIDGDKNNLVMLRAIFEIEYFEPLT